MIAIINRLDKPVIAKIPKTDNTQRIKSTIPISLIGEGSIPIAQTIKAKINRSHKDIGLPFMLNKIIPGITKKGRFK